jgi:uncharacterized protein YfkK (UPF0435 family)
MSVQKDNNPENPEIDLLTVFSRIGDFFEWINTLLFRIIRFFVKNAIVVAVLAVLGIGIGKYFDSTKKIYDSRIIVAPNFESSDYLYSKINLLKAKIAEGDTIYLKNTVGIQQPKSLKNIDVKAITDVYQFIEDKEENFELIKLMSEDEGLKKVLSDTITSKNYAYHKIYLTTNGLINNQNFVQPLLNYLNKSNYYDKIQAISLKNLQQEIVENDSILSQINSVLNGFSKSNISRNDKLVYYNENTQLNDVLKTKGELIKDQGKNRVKLVRYDKTIKEISAILNIKKVHKINGNLTYVLPVLFVLLFILLRMFVTFYKKQLLKEQARNN